MANRYAIFDKFMDKPSIFYDILDNFFGEHLGSGYSRAVFDYKLDKKYVAKIDTNTRGSNYMEWEVWNEVKNTRFAKYFAECKSISADGKILIQRKAAKIEWFHTIPKQLPAFFHDIRQDNFGVIDGKIVCIDYALNNLLSKGLTKEMVPVKWNVVRYSCSKA